MSYMQMVKTFTDDQLLELLNTHNSIQGVVKHITNGKKHEGLRSYIAKRADDIEWKGRSPNLSSRYTVDDLKKAFEEAGCWSDIYRSLKVTVCDHNKKGIIRSAQFNGIEVPSFTKEDLIKAYQRGKREWLEADIFCCDSKFARSNLRKAALRFNALSYYKCSECGCEPIHNNKVLVLELDHINGMHNDNRKDNLRWLCPNCHSQTHTFKGKNNKKFTEQPTV